jgi:hypothetical protein
MKNKITDTDKLTFKKLNDYGNTKINQWLSVFDDLNKKKLLKKLNNENDNNFMSYYWELAVGFLFTKAGFDVEYEKNINNKTPDWFIKKGNQQFVVEVATLLESKIVIKAIEEDISFEVQTKKLEDAIIKKMVNSKNFEDPYIIVIVIGALRSGVHCGLMDKVLNGSTFLVTNDYIKMESRRSEITPQLKNDNIYCHICCGYSNDSWEITPYIYNNSRYKFDKDLFAKLDSFNGKSDDEINDM